MEKKKQNENYSAPKCEIVLVSENTNLMDTSFPSQHRKANHASGPTASAKAFGLWNDEHFEDGNNEGRTSSWDD